jgi:hypothetical protein
VLHRLLRQKPDCILHSVGLEECNVSIV